MAFDAAKTQLLLSLPILMYACGQYKKIRSVHDHEGKAECFLDEESGLYYSYLGGKKLFLNRRYKTKEQAEYYIKSLMIEDIE